jgi:hypothetical protein
VGVISPLTPPPPSGNSACGETGVLGEGESEAREGEAASDMFPSRHPSCRPSMDQDGFPIMWGFFGEREFARFTASSWAFECRCLSRSRGYASIELLTGNVGNRCAGPPAKSRKFFAGGLDGVNNIHIYCER